MLRSEIQPNCNTFCDIQGEFFVNAREIKVKKFKKNVLRLLPNFLILLNLIRSKIIIIKMNYKIRMIPRIL